MSEGIKETNKKTYARNSNTSRYQTRLWQIEKDALALRANNKFSNNNNP